MAEINPEPYLAEFTDPGEGPFYTSYLIDIERDYPDQGLRSPILDWSDVPKLNQIKSELAELFDTMYMFREIGQETYDRWMYTVKRRFDTVKRKYNTAFEQYENENLKDANPKTKETYSSDKQDTFSNSSESDNSNEQKFQDTPITQLDSQADYQTTKQKSSGSQSSGQEGESSGTLEYERTIDRTDKPMVIYLNEYSDQWRDLELQFVREFQVCFFAIVQRV